MKVENVQYSANSKVENLLQTWKDSKKALLIDGARQVGKTYILRKFAEDNFSSVFYLNLYENKRAVPVLRQATDSVDFMRRLSVFSNKPFVKGETLIFLDEIQELQDFDLVIQVLPAIAACAYIHWRK